VDIDATLLRAYDLGMDEAGWTDAVMDEAEELLPALVEAGYAERDEWTWKFTPKGIARVYELRPEEADLSQAGG
jgi:hypothetical protein